VYSVDTAVHCQLELESFAALPGHGSQHPGFFALYLLPFAAASFESRAIGACFGAYFVAAGACCAAHLVAGAASVLELVQLAAAALQDSM
jgi:hypothetical protein